MENETVIPSPENTPAVDQPAVTSPSKSNALLPIVLTLVISGVVFGVGGFYLGSQSNRALAPENPSPAPLMAEQDPSTPPSSNSSISDFRWDCIHGDEVLEGWKYYYTSRCPG